MIFSSLRDKAVEQGIVQTILETIANVKELGGGTTQAVVGLKVSKKYVPENKVNVVSNTRPNMESL